ncbi:hypothetical protein [Halomonas sp.]|uniref:hypothetical protein n=1 Tax=Halomonas sp. TaxID=1486246 RepID=UPI0035676E05
MYDEDTLKALANRLLDRQDEPFELLSNLTTVRNRQSSDDVPKEMQRFELRLELNGNDMETIIEEVEAQLGVEDDE